MAVGLALLSGCIVGTGNDALKTHATNPPNQGGERAVRTTKCAAASPNAPGDMVFLVLDRLLALAAEDMRSANSGPASTADSAISGCLPSQFRWTFFDAFVYNPATF